ncbi:MAG: polyprenyl synthetase family protein [Alphaproteobacteria bacterium GM202ARS2]|nr:polyprenyl synthetase family protein [Alphaproteobacteria bacterium GM202ARS2]
MAVILNIDKEKHDTPVLQVRLDEDMHKVDQLITQSCQSSVALSTQIIQHLLDSGGKRLRPKLTLASAYLCDYRGNEHLRLAACIEFIHSATLLHDDVIDESTVRRGNKTACVLWGNKPSILVGDFLLSRAFDMVVQHGDLAILKLLCDSATTIAEGELLQLTHVGDIESTENLYLDIIKAKTARLFACACQLGALVTHKPDALRQALDSFGLNFGIAFQLIDDVLDYQPHTQPLGKPAGNDFFEKKITLPVILAYRRGNAHERAFWQRCMQEAKTTPADLHHATQLIRKHQADKDSIQRAHHYATMAKDSLALLPKNSWHALLTHHVDACIQRAQTSTTP